MAPGFVEQLIPDLRPGARPEAEQRRLRKLTFFALVIFAACLTCLGVFVAQSSWRSSVSTLVVLIDAALTLFALRRRVPIAVVTTAFLSVGLVVAAVMGISAGPDGMISIFWMSAAPLVGLAVGGRRAGVATLGLTVLVIAVSLVGIEFEWLGHTNRAEQTLFTHISSLLMAGASLFLLFRAYEVETERIIGTLEQHNQALITARAEADQANRSKGDFLAMMSHELRTPLNGVTGMAALLANEQDPARLAEGLRVMQQSADTLLAVINDVLDFSKIEANELELESVSFNPRGELETVVDLLRSRADAQGTQLEARVTPEVPQWVGGDPMRLRQIAMNLVSNAVKFAPQGRVSCSLEVNEGQLSLAVEDTGIGMAPDVVRRLFTPFTQADASTTRRFGGTGLGLVITRRLVDAMGGSIAVTSTEGQGSRFRVLLPIESRSAPEQVLPVVMGNRRLRVLLVEDNAVNQLVTRRLLELLGHDATVTGDGSAALEACRHATFDLVLMDCQMPTMDGFEATRALRASGFTTPICALTAAVSTEDMERCRAAGMNEVLSKPLRVERLRQVLDALTQRDARSAA